MHPEILSQAKIAFTVGLNISRGKKKSFIFRCLCLKASDDLSKSRIIYNSHFSLCLRKFVLEKEGTNTEQKEKQCHSYEPKSLQA